MCGGPFFRFYMMQPKTPKETSLKHQKIDFQGHKMDVCEECYLLIFAMFET